MIYNLSSYKQELPSLGPGNYEWTIKAKTLDDLDISAADTYHFTVEEIPPFEAPSNAHTEGNGLFNTDYLRKTPYIVFHWNKVKHASDYVLEIRNHRNKVLKSQIINGNANTSFKLEDLASLEKGDFNWQVKAILMDKNKKVILINGEAAQESFTIDYNLKTSGAKKKNTGALYAE